MKETNQATTRIPNEEFESIVLKFSRRGKSVNLIDIIYKVGKERKTIELLSKEFNRSEVCIKMARKELSKRIANYMGIEEKNPQLAIMDIYHHLESKDFFAWYYNKPLNINKIREKRQAFLDLQEREGLTEHEFNFLIEYEAKQMLERLENKKNEKTTMSVVEISGQITNSEFKKLYKLSDVEYEWLIEKGILIEDSFTNKLGVKTFLGMIDPADRKNKKWGQERVERHNKTIK